jgi:hypothetical protein
MFFMKRIRAFFNPEQYHGWGRTRRYFEGWYYKLMDHFEQHAFAVIPGIAMDEAGNRQGFIQVLDGKKQTAEYFAFKSSEFIPVPGKFELRIGDNFFSAHHIRLNLPGMSGDLFFSGNVPCPSPWYSPGIMGPYSFAPFMECNHGVVSMDHEISGQLEVGDTTIPFDKGRGYIEKDWGRSFPSAYIWMQTNHFSAPGVSFFASVAKIPWIRNSFTGFIAGIWLHDHLIKFTTYNGTSLRKCRINADTVELIMENKRHHMEVNISRDHATSLASPIQGFMDGRIEESMTSEIHIRLLELKTGKTIYQDTGRHAGLDVAGNIDDIII